MEKDYSFLPVFLEEPLYLIATEAEQGEDGDATEELSFLGENKSHITVMVEHEKGSFQKSAEYQKLLEILSAVSLSQHEVAIVPIKTMDEVSFGLIQESLAPQKVMIFGKVFSRNPVNAENYQVAVEKGVSYLVSESLKTISNDRNKKVALWQAMKKLFAVG